MVLFCLGKYCVAPWYSNALSSSGNSDVSYLEGDGQRVQVWDTLGLRHNSPCVARGCHHLCLPVEGSVPEPEPLLPTISHGPCPIHLGLALMALH